MRSEVFGHLPPAGGHGLQRWFRRLRGAAAAFLVLAPLQPASAEPLPRELLLVAQVLGFLEQPPAGDIDVGILHLATNRLEAEQVAAQFGGGVRAGGVVLRPRLLPLDQLNASMPQLLLLTRGMVPMAATVARAVEGRGVLTVTPDPALIDDNLAVLAVRASPRVEIMVSRAAAQSAAISFAGAFRMMIQER